MSEYEYKSTLLGMLWEYTLGNLQMDERRLSELPDDIDDLISLIKTLDNSNEVQQNIALILSSPFGEESKVRGLKILCILVSNRIPGMSMGRRRKSTRKSVRKPRKSVRKPRKNSYNNK